jgi:hypothetical protein
MKKVAKSAAIISCPPPLSAQIKAGVARRRILLQLLDKEKLISLQWLPLIKDSTMRETRVD